MATLTTSADPAPGGSRCRIVRCERVEVGDSAVLVRVTVALEGIRARHASYAQLLVVDGAQRGRREALPAPVADDARTLTLGFSIGRSARALALELGGAVVAVARGRRPVARSAGPAPARARARAAARRAGAARAAGSPRRRAGDERGDQPRARSRAARRRPRRGRRARRDRARRGARERPGERRSRAPDEAPRRRRGGPDRVVGARRRAARRAAARRPGRSRRDRGRDRRTRPATCPIRLPAACRFPPTTSSSTSAPARATGWTGRAWRPSARSSPATGRRAWPASRRAPTRRAPAGRRSSWRERGSASASTATATAAATRTPRPTRSRRWRATCAPPALRRTGTARCARYNHSDVYANAVERLAAKYRRAMSAL